MRATDELRAADVAHVPDLLAGTSFLVLDANPPAEVLAVLLEAAADAAVPVVVEPVSVVKADGVRAALADGRPVHTVTPNVDELAALVGREVGPDTGDVLAAADELHRHGVRHVWVRRGERGSLLSVDDGTAPRRAVAVGAPATEVVDVTGAGDAMTAGYVHALLAGADVVEAARLGQVAAALTCASPETVRSDLSAALLRRHLTPTDPPVEETHR